jgi:hypothetical protein
MKHTKLILQTREWCFGLFLQRLLVKCIAANARVAQQIALSLGRSGSLGAIVVLVLVGLALSALATLAGKPTECGGGRGDGDRTHGNGGGCRDEACVGGVRARNKPPQKQKRHVSSPRSATAALAAAAAGL